ncbi:MAG: GNAT family N-acetyltransferase [Chloroflexota bacterium]|nr:GNAT family N-acetyltransferase [Chloroflexota bacterium]
MNSEGANGARPDPGADPPVINIVGDLVALGPLRRGLVPRYHRWHNDLAVSGTRGVGWPVALEQTVAEFERQIASDREVAFTIYDRAALRPIGVCALSEIEHRFGRATFAITIGEADCRGKGYGTEATRLALDYAFAGLGLVNVMLTCFAFNLGGRRAYEKAGFREFGRRRRCSRHGGRSWDLIYMECLADEFVSPVLARVLLPDVREPTGGDRQSDQFADAP